MSGFNLMNIKLAKIKQSIRFPDENEPGLPYLERDVAACTASVSSDHDVDEAVEEILTEAHLINWCRTIHKLRTLRTLGEGNQFLCAVSTALWGFSDGASLLRRLMFVFISEFAKDPLFERWVRNTDDDQVTVEDGFKRFIVMSRCPSTDMEDSTSEGWFPLPLHIFVMANVLRRGIVVIGDEDDIRTGLYLPVLLEAEVCIKWPLVFAFHEGSYLPLVNEELPRTGPKIAEFAVPLVSSNLLPLKMRFLLDSEERQAHSLLQRYLSITDLNLTRSSDICLILSAKLNSVPLVVEGERAIGVSGAEVSETSEHNQEITGTVVLPTAPSASIVTLNNLSEPISHPEEVREMSMLQETCRFPGCGLFVSRYTEPFCWEHVEEGRIGFHPSRPNETRPSEESVEVSMLNERCREADCPNFASRFIYPFCYEHIDRKTVESVIQRIPKQNLLPVGSSVVMEHCNHGSCRNYASQYIYPFCYEHIDDREVFGASSPVALTYERPISQEYDVSLMVEPCIHPNCHNRASKYTFPVCYEHLDSPLAISRVAAATSVVQLPHPIPTKRRIFSGNQQAGSPKKSPQGVAQADKKFEETMKELEARTKNGVPLCLRVGCTNFGNSKCRGYCHSCYKRTNHW